MVADDRLAHARAAAASVPDPEIPALTIEDLGMLHDVTLCGDTVEVAITPSYLGCPATVPIAQDVVAALARAGFPHARVRTVLAPPWSSDRITAAGRRKLAESGIAPPDRALRQPICPRCGSGQTEQISAFGATPCKALHRCLACREPFEAFKCH
ncbi:MAG TPA: 1,2-phenylacetyl-CoA epoxidase subunit PaaD [Acetobacteraceae bacterium]|nr:1,2-phenylacetyl-CoA epoxidase subunit PaaD [Acetobacteraceae bacterium]